MPVNIERHVVNNASRDLHLRLIRGVGHAWNSRRSTQQTAGESLRPYQGLRSRRLDGHKPTAS